MDQKKLNKGFIWGFLFLYLMVAMISFCHAIQFFNIGNERWMSIVLAFSFELGLALSLASILLSDKNKTQTFPWILMVALTTVQVIGNVYSVFKYVSVSQEDYYQYLANSLLFFLEEVDQNTIRVIVSWIMGAILPIVALLMTDMVASNIKFTTEPEQDSEKNDMNKQDEHIVNKSITNDVQQNNNKPTELTGFNPFKLNLFNKKKSSAKSESDKKKPDANVSSNEQNEDILNSIEPNTPDDLSQGNMNIEQNTENIHDFDDTPSEFYDDTINDTNDLTIPFDYDYTDTSNNISESEPAEESIENEPVKNNREESLSDYYHVLSGENKPHKSTGPYVAEIVNDPFKN